MLPRFQKPYATRMVAFFSVPSSRVCDFFPVTPAVNGFPFPLHGNVRGMIPCYFQPFSFAFLTQVPFDDKIAFIVKKQHHVVYCIIAGIQTKQQIPVCFLSFPVGTLACSSGYATSRCAFSHFQIRKIPLRTNKIVSRILQPLFYAAFKSIFLKNPPLFYQKTLDKPVKK